VSIYTWSKNTTHVCFETDYSICPWYYWLRPPSISFIHRQFDLLHWRRLSWLSTQDTRRYTFGYCVYLDDNLISWSAKCQHTLSRSSAKIYYIEVANVVYESCWLCNLLLELYCPITKATLVYCDNINIYLSDNTIQYQRTKHIEMDIHFVLRRLLAVKYVFFTFPLVFRLLTYSQRDFRNNSLMTFEIVSTFAHLQFRLRECIRIIIIKKLGSKGTCILWNFDLKDLSPQETINAKNM